jgi:uncharacterized protein
MAHVEIDQQLALESPTLVEGLPGVGLVGKIAADHIVDTYDMTYMGACYCDGLPEVAVYSSESHQYRPPVRIYGDEDRDLLVLQSDVPVSPNVASEFASCITGWFQQNDVTPIYLSGLPEEKDGVPDLYGIVAGDRHDELADPGIDPPPEDGVVTGPTGALLSESARMDMDATGLIVQANAQFPDPEAARVLLLDGVQPLADIEIDTEPLVDQAEEIAEARQKLAKRMQQADDESTQAQPLGMYQ